MRLIIKKMNEEIFGFIHHLESNPKRARPVTFWFYSDHELHIYRLAAHLKNDGTRFTVHGVEGCRLNVEGFKHQKTNNKFQTGAFPRLRAYILNSDCVWNLPLKTAMW